MTFLATIFDVFIYKWFSTIFYMGSTHMVEKSKGNIFETWEFMKDNYWL